MLKTIFRIFIYIICAFTIWLFVQFYIAQDLKKQIYNGPEKTLFVDQSASESSYAESLYDARFTNTQKILLKTFSPIEQKYLGTPLLPFIKIEDALSKMDETGIRMIKVNNGTYTETLALPENTTLIGSGDETIIYSDPLSLKDTLTTNNNSYITNITISGGKNAISIPTNTSATFDQITASGASDFGVKMESKDRPDTPEGEDEIPVYEYYEKSDEEINALPLVRFVNVTVTKNKDQGMYLRDGRVEIISSQIIENGEEGIDLHSHMHATIRDVTSSNNGESGLETEIYDNTIIIENSIFDNNLKNGIAFITSLGVGEVFMYDNTITNNKRYGTRCAVHKTKPKKPRPFFQTVIQETDSYYEENVEGSYGPRCLNF